MSGSDAKSVGDVREVPIDVVAADGYVLAGTWFVPSDGGGSAPTMAVAVACGGGIPARYYHRLARHLAARGAAVLCCDYRGIGASRGASLRGLHAGMEHWAELDFGAVMAQARARYPDTPLGAVAHSVGTMLVGAAVDARYLSRVAFLGPHTGYWRDYGARWRLLLYLNWHVMMPVLTKMVGYFPGRALRMGQDLPHGFALDWSRRRRPELVNNPEDHRRFDVLLARFADMRAKTLAISITDDAFAPPAAASRILALYPNVDAYQEVVRPGDVGVRRLGHMGFLRRSTGEFFWNRTAAWLLQDEPVKNTSDGHNPRD